MFIAVVSIISTMVVVSVTAYAILEARQAQQYVDKNMRSLVDQINAAQYYKYNFDKLQEANIKNMDQNTHTVNDGLKHIRQEVFDTMDTLEARMKRVESTAMKKTDFTNGADYLKVDRLRLGNQHMLSGAGDFAKDKPDGWLRLMDKDGKGLYGGLAADKLMSTSSATLNGLTEVNGTLNISGGVSEHNPSKLGTVFMHPSDKKNYIRGDTDIQGHVKAAGNLGVGQFLTLKGGASEHNPQGWGTWLPWDKDQKNYVRGDTEIWGNTVNKGDMHIQRHANVDGKLSFGESGRRTASSLPAYSVEKVFGAGNKPSLRMTINNTSDDSFQIWGNACEESAGCDGVGAMQHVFQANGNVTHRGNMSVGGTIAAQGMQVSSKPDDAQANAWMITRSGSGAGESYLSLGGNKSIHGLVAQGNKPLGFWDDGGERMIFDNGRAIVKGDLEAGRMCAGSTCVNESELKRLKELLSK